MSERVDVEVKRVVCEAAGEPRSGLRARALGAMAASHPTAHRLRLVPNAIRATLVVAALLSMPIHPVQPIEGTQVAMAADQMLAEADRTAISAANQIRQGFQRQELPDPLREYAAKAPDFVRKHYPNDSQMLITAGLLTRNISEAESLLKAAVRTGGGAALAAYATLLTETGPAYARPANWGADPTDPKSVARVREELANVGLPDSLSEAQAAPVLEALKRWEAAEPDNAYPVAMEVSYLYGLHRDREASEMWERASRMPSSDMHVQEFLSGTVRLLQALGASGWDAVSAAYGPGSPYLPYARIREGARIAGYEGKLAALEGRDEDAIRWWLASIRLGRVMQKSAPTLIECLVGIAVEGIGSAPTWVWQLDSRTGIPAGPLFGGRLFYGPQHALFVRVAGAAADADVRDSLVRGKMRSMLARQYTAGLGAFPAPILRAMTARAASLWTSVLLVASLIVFAAVSLVARRKADEATTLSQRARIGIWSAGLIPLLAGVTVMWLSSTASTAEPGSEILLFACFGAGLLVWLAAPLIAAFSARQPGTRLLTAWRGSLRKVLPLAVVTCAALSLALRLAGMRTEGAFVRQWLHEREMSRVVREIGPEWQNPKIPADAWRAQHPPGAGR